MNMKTYSNMPENSGFYTHKLEESIKLFYSLYNILRVKKKHMVSVLVNTRKFRSSYSVFCLNGVFKKM